MRGNPSHRLLVSYLPGDCWWVLLTDDNLAGVYVERRGLAIEVGDYLMGRVTRVDTAQNAAFLDCGSAGPAFLPLKAVAKRPLEGDRLTVKVTRAASLGKAIKVSAKGLNPVLDAENKDLGLLCRGEGPAALFAEHDLEEVVVEGASANRAFVSNIAEQLEDVSVLRHHKGRGSLFDEEMLSEPLEALLEQVVPLPSGGRLIIEPVSSMTAIDVDSGGDRRGQAEAINREAAEELVRQVTLRGLSGLLVVDFLELLKEERPTFLAFLKDLFRGDRAEVQVVGMSRSGLVEIHRQRLRAPLHELLQRPESKAFKLVRALPDTAAQAPGKALVIEAPLEVLYELKEGFAKPAFAEKATALAVPIETLEGPRCDVRVKVSYGDGTRE